MSSTNTNKIKINKSKKNSDDIKEKNKEKINTSINKSLKVKKNITIFKKDKIVKIKQTEIKKKKSMDEALDLGEVNLWGLNKIDSILLNDYEKKFKPEKIRKSTKLIKSNEIEEEKNKPPQIVKTTDTEYIPNNKYTWKDLEFLNAEYDRIEEQLSQMVDLNDEYDELMEKQDLLGELLEELKIQEKVYNLQYGIISNELTLTKKNDKNENNENDENKSNKSIKSTKTTKSTKTKFDKIINVEPSKLKPYYFIGKIPEGYREATEEEAITNKKVSFYGKRRVNRELNNLFEITGTIYINTNDIKKLNNQIIALKGKLSYYKKEYEFNKISLDSDSISDERIEEIKEKITQIKNSYKKTLDLYNLYVKKFNELNNDKNIKLKN